MYEQGFLMKPQGKWFRSLSQKQKDFFIEYFNNQYDIEDRPYEPKIIKARLLKFASNWIKNAEDRLKKQKQKQNKNRL